MLALESTYMSTGVLPSASDKNSGRCEILIVDDTRSARLLAARILGDGYDYTFATDGLEAVQQVSQRLAAAMTDASAPAAASSSSSSSSTSPSSSSSAAAAAAAAAAAPIRKSSSTGSLNGDEHTIKPYLPDLVLLDVEMPRLDGFGCCARLLTLLPPTAAIPIIFFTAGDRFKVEQAFDAGAHDYVKKPFEPAELRSRVASQLLQRANMKKEADRRVNDEVLQRLLPPRVVQRLRDADASASELCGSTAFLFLDVPAVREMAVTTEGGSLDELVAYLDTLFNLYDDLVRRHGLTTCDMLGPSYLVASGYPRGSTRHKGPDLGDATRLLLRLAVEMLAEGMKVAAPGGRAPRIRIGLHCGQSVACVIGSSTRPKFTFFGDTIEIAAALEVGGWPGAIQVSQDVIEASRLAPPAGAGAGSAPAAAAAAAAPAADDEAAAATPEFVFIPLGTRPVTAGGKRVVVQTSLLVAGTEEDRQAARAAFAALPGSTPCEATAVDGADADAGEDDAAPAAKRRKIVA